MALSKDVVIRLLGDASSADRAIRQAAAAADVSVAAYKRAERDYNNQQRALEQTARQHRENMAQIARGVTIVMGATQAAVTAAGLAVPAALVGISGAFAGIGIAAAAQNDEVRAAFAGLRDVVKDSAAEIGQPLADVLPEVADRIGASFQRMKPLIIDGVTAATPHVEKLTDATLQMAERALPGLVTAAENAGPAVDGLGRFLETAGTGIGQFFADLSTHAPAAGAAFDGLGQVIEELLPVLSDLIGRGADLAADALPALADALPLVHAGLSLVLDAAQMLGPVLPVLVAGFIGLKTAGAVGTLFQGVGTEVQLMASKLGIAGGAMTGLGKGLGAVGAALPVVGALVGVVATQWDAHGNALEANSQKFTTLITAMRQGGAAGEQAAAQLSGLNDIMEKGGMVANLLADAHGVAADAERDRLDALTPLEQAQERLETAERNVLQAVHDHGEGSSEAADKQALYQQAQLDVAAAADEEQRALTGVTQAMVDQTNQAMAAIDSSFAYQNAIDGLEDAQTAYTDAVRDHGAASEEASDAQRALAEDSYRAAQAYGKQQADLSGLQEGTNEYTRYLQQNTLQELYRLRDAAGPEMSGALQQQIDSLERSGVSLNESSVAARALREQVSNLASNVREVPGFKAVQIDVPTADQKRRIEELGNRVVTLPDGSVYVVADTADANRQIALLTFRRSMTVFVNTVFSGLAATGGPVMNLRTGGSIHHFDGGGPITGPGTGTSDSIVAFGPMGRPNYRLSNGEHIVTDEEVRGAGGHNAVMAQRRAWRAGAGVLAAYAGGGGIPMGAYAGPGSGAPALDYERLARELAAAVGPRGTTVQVAEWNNASQTPHETAEALTWLARR